jgi:RNA polymerase sigma-70 factor (ECF subfamily)
MTPPSASPDHTESPDSTPEPSDESLMTALATGNDTALDALMLRWQTPLRAFLHRHLQNEADALDLAQETFVRLYRHRDRYRPGARFSTWMFQIALNLARDHARKRARRRTDSLEGAPPAATAGLAAPGSAPDAAARRAEEVAAVRAAVAALPDDLREILVLFEYEDRSHAEIAEITGASPKSVEARLYRARDKLRSALARWLKS